MFLERYHNICSHITRVYDIYRWCLLHMEDLVHTKRWKFATDDGPTMLVKWIKSIPLKLNR